MAAVNSTMLPIGTAAPDFSLSDTVSGKTVTRADFEGKPLVVMFICNHCPFVKLVRDEIARVAREYQDKGVAFVAISANNVETHPDDSPDKMAAEAKEAGYTFPYLYDESQEVANAYRAACTPDFFLFDADHKLAYRGQLDDARPDAGIPVTGQDLRAAIDHVLAGEPVPEPHKPSMGCNIKWKPGNEPNYA